MSRISTPASIAEAPEASRPLLEAVNAQLGVTPNVFLVAANSPAALSSYTSVLGALAKGKLPGPTHERVALAVAEANGCDYCLSAHTYLGKHVARLDDAEMVANRAGRSNDPKAEAAVRFARKIMDTRGHVSDADVRAVRAAGYDDAQIVEIVQHVALNTWTNYLNSVAQTQIDFPLVTARKVA